ncbi:SSI family serine proteinase inhibitor [Embleya sp. NBC_00896]|uniref:SSI family serine proteinase inhibitor n=1 Tax=Embleya sp. NBC_00896 TaxID=2975961 RepID=UPI0038635D67|nr:subtilase-type protease inhibitor [Embleya sp. NBC_00896]
MSGKVPARFGYGFGCAVLAAATMLGGVAPASATPPAYGHLYLTVYQGEDTDGDALGRVELWCDANGGTHPDPDGACGVLDAADGDPANVPGTSGACTMQYEPVTAVAEGYWWGGVRLVDFTETYGNRCALRFAKAPLFDF